MFGYISLHSATLVPNDSMIMLVNILLFQHYSYQICNLLFLKLCRHNRLRPIGLPHAVLAIQHAKAGDEAVENWRNFN